MSTPIYPNNSNLQKLRSIFGYTQLSSSINQGRLSISPLNFVNETKEQIKKSRFSSFFTILFGFAVVVAILYYLTTNYSSNVFHTYELREGIIGQPRFLNPLFSEENEVDRTVTSLVFNGLIKYDFESKSFVGDIAEKYELEEDGKIYHFYLKNNIYFHDGQKLTIDDVIFTYEVIKSDNYHGFWKDAFSDVAIEKINDTELKMTLKTPLASFIEHNTVGILPKHLFKDTNDALRPDHIFNVSPIGTGKFKYFKKELISSENNKIESLILNNVDNKSQIKKIRFNFYDSEEVLLNAFKMGEIDSFGSLNSHLKQVLDGWSKKKIVTKTLEQRYYGMFFNLKSDKRINSVEVREAIVRSINLDELLKNVFPDENITKMISPIETVSWAYNKDIKTYEFDVEKSKELIKDIPQEELQFTLTYPDTEINYETVLILKRYLEDIGLKIETKSVPLYNLRDTVIGPRNFEILLLGQEVFHDPDRYALWHSTQTDYPNLNISQFKNRFADRALEQARKTTDQTKRITAYKDFQRYFQNEIPAIMLYQPNYYYFVVNRFADKIPLTQIYTPEDRFYSLLK